MPAKQSRTQRSRLTVDI